MIGVTNGTFDSNSSLISKDSGSKITAVESDGVSFTKHKPCLLDFQYGPCAQQKTCFVFGKPQTCVFCASDTVSFLVGGGHQFPQNSFF